MQGVRAEKRALDYLVTKGYQLVGQRIRTQTTEVDLIALQQDYIVFFEIKFSKKIDAAACRVDHKKKQRLIVAAEHFIQAHPEIYQKHPFIRFDVVLLSEDEIVHFENAFVEE